MNNIILGQYDSKKYTLNHFFYNEIPYFLKTIIINLVNNVQAIIRGGLAYIFLLDDFKYELKDIDLFVNYKKKEEILAIMSSADIIYINKNTFNKTVITGFWQNKNNFFKIDILLFDKTPPYFAKKIDGITYNIVTSSYIWSNRIQKIAEKNKRNHSDEKTLNHYNVALNVSLYLLNHKSEILQKHAYIVKKNLDFVYDILKKLINLNKLNYFVDLQRKLINEHKDFNMSA